MTISIWRYCHLLLALASSLFLVVASVTGVILALEPISHQTKGYAVENLDAVSLATSIEALKHNYDEVFSLEVESSGFVKASVLTMDMESLDIYVNPNTGEQLGLVKERPYIYSFATNLHRSLFLKSIGRFFVGLISFLLFIIAFGGVFLLAKRQGGFRRVFSKVKKDYFEMRYHVILSRWFLIPITILALTGVYLSAEKFELLPDASIAHQVVDNATADVHKPIRELPFFKETVLAEVRKVDFPFSDDIEDYYLIALKDRELKVNQQTGAIVSSVNYPFATVAARYSWLLHTGEGNPVWSVILLLASASILFFMYSGFVMTIKRRKKILTSTTLLDKDDCEVIILVGSETGSTFDFANRLYKGLSNSGQKVFLSELNTYTTYAKAKQLIVLTSTYGKGEPPTNARKFEALFPTIRQPNDLQYSVVGFGSLEYPDYCQFALKVDALLQAHSDFQPVVPLVKINNANETEFDTWSKQWSHQLGIDLHIEQSSKKKKKPTLIPFEVIERTDLNIDETFLLRLRPKKNIAFSSGDLLAIYPNDSDLVRQYSIAKIGQDILLSIKKHPLGIGSSFLFDLTIGDKLQASIDVNPDFHFPHKAKAVILIANGTGIAPFFGMIDEHKSVNTLLFWGGRTKESFNIYESVLKDLSLKGAATSIRACFSREENKQYVQDLIVKEQELLLQHFESGGCVMICGSLAMQHAVLDVLELLLKASPELNLERLEQQGQLKMDCY